MAYAPALMNVACPVPAAIGTEAQISGTGFGHAFHLTTDLPVVAYQMLPYGGGAAAATGASLLLPTSAWGDNYVAVSAYDAEGAAPPPIPFPIPAQGPSFLKHYVFFTDPTYPFTVLTVVRKGSGGAFHDVTLDCMGTVSGFQPVGTAGEYEIAHVKLVDAWTGMAGCNNGVQQMDSTGEFGVWVWGWGSESTNTGWVSYGYPAGEAVLPINDVIVD